MIGPGMMISDRYEIIDKVGSGGNMCCFPCGGYYSGGY